MKPDSTKEQHQAFDDRIAAERAGFDQARNGQSGNYFDFAGSVGINQGDSNNSVSKQGSAKGKQKKKGKSTKAANQEGNDIVLGLTGTSLDAGNVSKLLLFYKYLIIKRIF